MAASQAQSEVGLKERFYRDFQQQVSCKNLDPVIILQSDQNSTSRAN
jgi:hypothetical protein